MKTQLLKNIRNNCHIQYGSGDLKATIYSKDFEARIDLWKDKDMLYFLEYWKGYVGCSENDYNVFARERKRRQNKKEYNWYIKNRRPYAEASAIK